MSETPTVLEQAEWLLHHLPEDGKEVFVSRLTAEVEHTKERYASYLPQVSVDPEDAVETLGLTPPVEDEVVETPVDKVQGLTTAPDYSNTGETAEEPVVEKKSVAPVTKTTTPSVSPVTSVKP